ncbi:hypothetical protein CVT24_005138 [Panaeolus cyanescens]|uniref:ERCC1-like central domain-containing protein n=1 Tax=Panaeolus cyanescens TaxID=181874 RepID=A0A409V9P9_9AGAR|nr:hypothetical protein CVT24_005138 [Panaeolus cyanescens]
MAATNKPPPVVLPSSSNNIIISPTQRGNPVLECIKNVGKEFGDIVVDYQVGRTTGVLFLSLKYHRLHPEYIHSRIERLGRNYNLRILLVLCDITEHREPIRELTKVKIVPSIFIVPQRKTYRLTYVQTCLINDITIIVAFSFDEAGHYLATFKQFEFKPPNLIKERVDKDYHSMIRTTLTSIGRVNKTDVETLRINFGSLAEISKASPDQLQNLPGFGNVKIKNISNAFGKPFRDQTTSRHSASAFIQAAATSRASESDGANDADKDVSFTVS